MGRVRAIGGVAVVCGTIAGVAAVGYRARPVLAAGQAAGQANPARLQTVLQEMDAGAAKFHSAEAEIKKEQYTKIVNDTESESGTIYFLRNGFQGNGGSIQVGAKFAPPTTQTMEYKNGKVRLYSAATNHIQEYSTSGKNEALAQTFLTLGFGGSGKDLAREWTITDDGPEQMSDGGRTVTVEKLDLVSKDAGVRNSYPHVAIWVDPARDVALKQEFFTPAGDTQTAIYTNIRLNQPIDLKAFAIQCEGKCS